MGMLGLWRAGKEQNLAALQGFCALLQAAQGCCGVDPVHIKGAPHSPRISFWLILLLLHGE